MIEPLLFPRDLLYFLYWVFFKPITLGRYIRQIDPMLVEQAGIFTLWRHSKEHAEFRSLIYLGFFHVLVTPWLLAFLSTSIFALAGFDVNAGFSVKLGVVFVIAFGMFFGVVGSMAIGVAAVVAGGATVGVAIAVVDNMVGDMGVGVAFGLVFGVVVGVMASMIIVAEGMADRMTVGVVVSAAFVVASVGGNDWFSVMCVAVGVSFGISYFRLGNYLIEAPYSFILSRYSVGRDLRLSPVVWDELILLPLPGLDSQLVSISKENRQEGIKAIAYVADLFNQGWAVQRAILELTTYDVRTSKNLEAIASISETLSWLPPETRVAYKSLLVGLETVSKHAKASLESDTLYNRQVQLRLALNETQSLRREFAYGLQFNRLMLYALEAWESLLTDELAIAQKEETIPNVYVAGNPLEPKSKVFRGRRDVFKTLEQELSTPAEQRPTILLFGARRTGKTSVLRQLPEILGPQVIPIAVDLQDSALEKDAAGLLYKVAEKIRSDALLYRHIRFGELSHIALEASPYSAFAEWLKKLQEIIGERWILLNLDEYEYLEKMLNDGRVDKRLFQMLRTFLQNHPRLTLLLSGAHTFEDLNPIWSHHLINARVVKVNPLSEGEARELITKPIPDYPLVYTETAVKDILEATACQPYLIQAVCRDLVNMKNDAHQFHANQKNVAKALESVLVSATAYFQDLWEGPDTDEAQRVIMGAIARSKSGSLDLKELNKILEKENFMQASKVRQRALRMLGHRDILKSNKTGWSFQIPLVRTWIRVKQFGLKK